MSEALKVDTPLDVHAEVSNLQRPVLRSQALSATATITRRAPVKLKRPRTHFRFEIPMVGPHTLSTGRIAFGAQGEPNA